MAESYQPLISVLVPSYNHEGFIRECIESIWSQPYKNIEIVVVDDCSTDSSPDILKDLQKRSPVPMHVHFNERNLGVAATVNRAIAEAQGKLVASVASDDKFAPDRFGSQLEQFQRDPETKVVFGYCRTLANGKLGKRLHVDLTKNLLSLELDQILRYLYTNKSPIFLQSALARTEFLRRTGGCDEDALVDDWLVVVRMFENLRDKQEFAFVPEDIEYHRIHETNLSRIADRQACLKLQFVEKYTPNYLKSIAYSNIHFEISRKYLKFGKHNDAWLHYKSAQYFQFKLGRLPFLLKIAKKYLASHVPSENRASNGMAFSTQPREAGLDNEPPT